MYAYKFIKEYVKHILSGVSKLCPTQNKDHIQNTVPLYN